MKGNKIFDSLSSAAAGRGDKLKIIPVGHLGIARRYLQDLDADGQLNGFQQWVVNELYNFTLPGEFAAQSVIIAARPSAPYTRLLFHCKGRNIPALIPATYADYYSPAREIAGYLEPLLANGGYQIKPAPQLPRKLLAAASGLGVYGRNNVIYSGAMGSFFNMALFYSDLPCADTVWHEPRRMMERCATCTACADNCPTAAIGATGKIIDGSRCLTNYNENGGGEFPDWIEKSAHNAIYGCVRCQFACPLNKPLLDNFMPGAPLEFSEEETLLLMAGADLKNCPEELQQKIAQLEMQDYLKALPRNLAALFAKYNVQTL